MISKVRVYGVRTKAGWQEQLSVHILICKRRQRGHTGSGTSLLKPPSLNSMTTLPPTRSHPVLHNQFHQPVTKYSNMTYGVHCHSNHHHHHGQRMLLPLCLLFTVKELESL